MDLRRAGRGASDRGAVAVEFALLLPLLLIVIFGVIDFGRALNAQITITQAAREGARLAALGQPAGTVQAQAVAAGSPIGVTTGDVTPAVCAPNAGPTANGSVQISYPFSFITPIGALGALFGHGFSSSLTLHAQGVMPCET